MPSVHHLQTPEDRDVAALLAGGQAGLEDDLRRALAGSHFLLHWQPIVTCTTGDLLGFEALVRWNRPGHGNTPPSGFVPLMQQLDLFRRFDTWLLDQACNAITARPGQFVAINVSARWFEGAGLIAAVAAALERSGIEPHWLEIEVSEATVIATKDIQHHLNRLKALGVHLSLDDFGAGPASLATLHEMPFDTLKLDSSFVGRLGQCRRTEAIIRAVLQMGKSLDLTICAEGVEHPDQLAILQAYGCDRVQGHLIGYPEHALPDTLDFYDRLDRSRLFMATAGKDVAATWM